MAELKLGRLPNRTPVKLTISLNPDLHTLLLEYLDAYRTKYDDDQSSITDLIPAIIAGFIESDRAFITENRRKATKI